MPLREEVWQSVYGAWRIARMDPDAMRYFNLSIDGFWRSFTAVPLVAPVLLVVAALTRTLPGDVPTDEPLTGFLLGRLALIVLPWLAFPLVMIPISRLLGLSRTYVPFVIAWNWAHVPVAGLFLIVALLVGSGLLPQNAAVLLLLLAQISALFYGYLVTRLALDCPAGMAIGIVVLDLLIDILINLAGEQMF